VVYSMKDASKIHTLEGIFEADREARELAKAYLNI